MKQTAVSWLEQEFVKLEATIGVHGKMYELIEQAKEKEKQQIVDSFHQGQISVCEIIANERKVSIPKDVRSDFEDANNYYNQTYNQ